MKRSTALNKHQNPSKRSRTSLLMCTLDTVLFTLVSCAHQRGEGGGGVRGRRRTVWQWGGGGERVAGVER